MVQKHNSPELLDAAFSGNLDLVKMMLQEGAEVNSVDEEQNNSLMFASYGDRLEVIKYLIGKGIDINAKNKHGYDALAQACENGNYATLLLLLKHGAKFDEPNLNGQTPLMLAAGRGHLKIVKTLVDKGADTTKLDNTKNTVFMHAVLGTNYDLVVYLAGICTNISAQNSYGSNALIEACTSSNIRVVRYLVEELKFDINLANNFGKTSLMGAAEKGNTEILIYLLQKGAQLDLKDQSGMKAIDFAKKGKHQAIVDFIASQS